MKNDILEISYELKEELKNDPRVILLNELENEMNNNDEVIALAYRKDIAADNYADMVRLFKDDSEEAKAAMKSLSNAKANLDNHPLVKKYMEAYKSVRELYNSINETLFSSLSAELCPKEHK